MDEHTWEEHCIGHAADPDLDVGEVAPKQLCLVAFLPHILDSKAAGRQAYLEVGPPAAQKHFSRWPLTRRWCHACCCCSHRGAKPG